MANGKGPSTALQVAVIIFAMLTVGLGAFSFYAFNQWNEEYDKKKLADATAAYNNSRINDASNNIGKLVKIITGKEDSSAAAVKAALDQYDVDMKRAGDTFTQFHQGDVKQQLETRHGTLRNYRDAVQLLVSTVAATKSSVDDPSIGETSLYAARAADITNRKRVADEEVNAVAEDEVAPGVPFTSYAESNSQKSIDLDGHSDRITAKTKQMDADNKELADKARQLTDLIATTTTAFETQLSKLRGELNKRETSLRMNKTEINRRTRETFEVADGEITWVNARSRTVWLNLGRADKLVPQVFFSVYGRDGEEIGRGKRKGALEVTRILDERLAEARILEDDVYSPLLPGDKVFTPAWNPGRPEHVGLAGFMDVDGNGISDLELVFSILRAASGVAKAGDVVDAYQLPNGDIVGELSGEKTRYLILGDEPNTGNAAALLKFGELVDKADKLGIKTIKLKDFLSQIGFTETTDFKEFGLASNPRDFDSVGRKSEESGKAVARFRERNAPRRGDLGAYGKEDDKK